MTAQYPETPDQFKKTHLIFQKAFTTGFPWEVIKVLSQPPEVVFLWRHWADFDGKFMDKDGGGRRVEMYGMTRAMLNGENKIKRLEVYFDPETFLKVCDAHAFFPVISTMKFPYATLGS